MPIILPRRMITSRDLCIATTARSIREELHTARPRNMSAISSRRHIGSLSTGPCQSQHGRLPSLPPHQPDPPLLLMGDELHVSPQGVTRSCYQLQGKTASSWTIEESYDLVRSTKSFALSPPFFRAPTAFFDIQELDTRLAGTGGTTWEASIAMALFFASHPEQLRGNVVELGSGVGLGGMLLHHVAERQHNTITLTDGNDHVLQQCRANIDRYVGSSLTTRKLDWNEVLSDPTKEQPKYNTVLACDCAYRSQDIPALTKTLKALLLQEDGDSLNQIHLFGPYNRAAYGEVIQWMENDKDLQVQVDWIELKRFRLHQTIHDSKDDHPDKWDIDGITSSLTHYPGVLHHEHSTRSLEADLNNASQATSKFLHVTANLKNQGASMDGDPSEQHRYTSLSDID